MAWIRPSRRASSSKELDPLGLGRSAALDSAGSCLGGALRLDRGGALRLGDVQPLHEQHTPRLPLLGLLEIGLPSRKRLAQGLVARLVRDPQQLLVLCAPFCGALGRLAQLELGLEELCAVASSDDLLLHQRLLLGGDA